MNNVFELLLSSPWFWIVLVLVILILAFRPQLARLIDRTQKAKAEAGKDGAKIELEAGVTEKSGSLGIAVILPTSGGYLR